MKFQDSVFALLSGIEAHFSKHKFSALKQIFLVVDQVKAMKECQQVLLSWTQVTKVCKLSILYSTPSAAFVNREDQNNESNYYNCHQHYYEEISNHTCCPNFINKDLVDDDDSSNDSSGDEDNSRGQTCLFYFLL